VAGLLVGEAPCTEEHAVVTTAADYQHVTGGCMIRMLWATYPDPAVANGWTCLGKAHNQPSPTMVTAYGLGLQPL